MPQQRVTATVEEIRKEGRSQKQWIDAIREDLKKMGIRNWHTVVRDWNWGERIALEAKVHS